MKRFIPTWYSRNRWWESILRPFYLKKQYTDFDDTVSLMTIYSSNNMDYQLIVLNFSPYSKTFLHRYDLYESHYWPVFGEIQDAGHQTPQAIGYRDPSWPEGTEFIFTPFQIQAIIGDNTFSGTHFDQGGYLMWVEDYKYSAIQGRFVLNDRGFILAVCIYTPDGSNSKKHYFSKGGEEISVEDLNVNTVTINKNF